MSQTIDLTYKPTGEVLRFHNSQKFIKAIAGPPGAGKTVACLWECVFRAMRQPADRNNERKFRVGVVRASYPNLRTSTLKTIRDWLPPQLGTIKETAPMEGAFTIPLADGTRVRLEMVFLAIENADEIPKLSSVECSLWWLTEATEVTVDVFNKAVERTGRYPSMKDGVLCAEPGVILDFNLPGTDHWLYNMLEAEGPDNIDFFMQPPAVFCDNFDDADAGLATPKFRLNPNAENLANLPKDYYANQLSVLMAAKDWSKIKSFLLMKWSAFNLGKLIFPEFSNSAHVSTLRSEPLQSELVFIGIDTSGLHPGAAFGQLQAGTLVVMDEAYGDDMAFEQFITDVLQPILATRYYGCKVLAVCDPSNPRDARTGVTPTQLLQQYGIRAIPAPSNKFALRREAVARLLTKRQGFVVDNACKTLKRGLGETYVYRKLKTATSTGAMYANEPDKGVDSHVVDALEYLCLHVTRLGQQDEVPSSIKGRVRSRRVM